MPNRVLFSGSFPSLWIYRQISNIKRILVGTKIVSNSGAAQTTSLFSTKQLVSMD